MSIATRNRRFSFLGTLVAAALALTAIALPLAPAKAQGFVGFQVGPVGFGFGVPGPAYAYPYYPPAYPYSYYYPGYYYPGYYYPRY
jgi:hypothetical protein